MSQRHPFIGFVLFLVLTVVGCQSTHPVTAENERPRGDDSVAFTTDHIDFQKWKRTPECCTAHGKSIAIASAGTHASRAGLEAHKRGCNLVDSAIATSFVLAVERPQSTGIGGGGFMTLHLAKPGHDGKSDIFVDFREAAPHRATADMFLDKKTGEPVKNLSLDGALAVGTPGFVAGMLAIYEKYGSHHNRCRWADLVRPAIELAEQGFTVYPSLAEKLAARKEVLLKDTDAAKLLLPNGQPLQVGDVLVQKDLAKTLDGIAKLKARGFYHGAIARKLTEYMREHQGLIDEKDLSDYAKNGTRFEEPLKGKFEDYVFFTATPPSAGGVALIESLNILSGFPLATETSRATYLHLLAETMRRTYADRLLIGDPKFVSDDTYRKLLTPAYADKARSRISATKVTSSNDINPGDLLVEEKPHTAHASLVDHEGNAVSVTTTVNYFFGAGVMVPGTGIFLNDEMDDFAKKVGAQNVTGLVGSANNTVEPYKHPVSSMAPTIFLKDGKPVLVVGAAGSSTIISSVLQTILNDLVLWKHDLRRAVFAGRAHHQWKDDKLMLEPKAFSLETESQLRKLGHVIDLPKFYAQVQAVDVHPETGVMTAVHDPRDEGGVEAQ